MIIEDEIIKQWNIYDAEQFKKEFNISEERDNSESDEEYIIKHLEASEKKFKIYFNESARGNVYEEYWAIKEVK